MVGQVNFWIWFGEVRVELVRQKCENCPESVSRNIFFKTIIVLQLFICSDNRITNQPYATQMKSNTFFQLLTKKWVSGFTVPKRRNQKGRSVPANQKLLIVAIYARHVNVAIASLLVMMLTIKHNIRYGTTWLVNADCCYDAHLLPFRFKHWKGLNFV